jgi:NAD-dependent deacetylase
MVPSTHFSSDLIEFLRRSRHAAVLTGAGVSAESGVPTFRDAQTGVWARFDPSELASVAAFVAQPRLVWDWYAWRRRLVAQAAPNPAHHALARLADLVPRLTLITQNVDGLHQAAGSQNVVELHGNILRTKCFNEDQVVVGWQETPDAPPRCPSCGGLLRPDVVWFGEALPFDAIQSAITAAESCDVFFSIGTSSLVEPAASLAHLARRAGAVLVEVNPDVTPLSPFVAHALRGPAGALLPELLRAVWPSAD